MKLTTTTIDNVTEILTRIIALELHSNDMIEIQRVSDADADQRQHGPQDRSG